jgi:transcription antitermination factor NusG
MHLAARGEECSRLLTPQAHELAVKVSGLQHRPRAPTNFLRTNIRFLSDGGEALSQMINVSTSATTTSVSLPPSLQKTERPPHWYAVYTSPRHEKRVREHLGHRRVECFLPLFRSVRRWKNGCKAQVELPLFPGYVFVSILRSERVRVLDVPGILSFVGPKGEPAQLPDVEIETLRSGLHLQKFEPYSNLIVGQEVRIKAGPLAGLAGVLVRSANGFRVVLTVELIQQSVAVELDAADVEAIAPRSIHAAPGFASSHC